MNPKLEFYKFKLNHKDEKKFKTFRDFAIDEFKLDKSLSDDEVFKIFFTKLMKNLNQSFTKDEKRQKAITLINDKTKNEYYDKRPSMLSSKKIISGVINGGPYGKKRIVADMDNKNNTSLLDKNQPVLLYFYIFVYIPPDHNEGFFIIHSNSISENITPIFRDHLTNIFKGINYNKPQPEIYAPKYFQEEYRKDAYLKSLTFSTTLLETIPSNHGFKGDINNFDIYIKIIPRRKGKTKISMNEAVKVFDFLSKNKLKTQKQDVEFIDFNNKKLEAENSKTKKPKTFEWDSKDKEFIPVVLLNNREEINILEDGTPDFEDLKNFCLKIFENEILKEIRPDLYVTRTN